MELWGKDAAYRGTVVPVFYSRAGEIAAVPAEFQAVAALVTAAVCCTGCRHCHLLRPDELADKIETKPASDAVMKTGEGAA